MSNLPNFATASSTSVSTLAAFRTFTSTKMASPPWLVMSSCVGRCWEAFLELCSKSPMTTFAPSRAYARAIARPIWCYLEFRTLRGGVQNVPMPLAPPVITATLSCNLPDPFVVMLVICFLNLRSGTSGLFNVLLWRA